MIIILTTIVRTPDMLIICFITLLCEGCVVLVPLMTTLRHGRSVHCPLVVGSSSIPPVVGELPDEKDDIMGQTDCSWPNCLLNLRFLEIASLYFGWGGCSVVVGPVVLKVDSQKTGAL